MQLSGGVEGGTGDVMLIAGSAGNRGTIVSFFGQLQGLSETEFTPPTEPLPVTLNSQAGIVLTTFGPDWISFDSGASLLDTQEPAVCLPLDQRVEESGSPTC